MWRGFNWPMRPSWLVRRWNMIGMCLEASTKRSIELSLLNSATPCSVALQQLDHRDESLDRGEQNSLETMAIPSPWFAEFSTHEELVIAIVRPRHLEALELIFSDSCSGHTMAAHESLLRSRTPQNDHAKLNPCAMLRRRVISRNITLFSRRRSW